VHPLNQENEKGEIPHRQTERRYDWLGKFGLFLIVAGTIAQIAGALLA
jgi:hypothetical protein